MDFLVKVYEQNRNSVENRPIFDKFIKILKMCVQFICVEFWLCTIACCAYPAATYYFSHGTVLVQIQPWFLPTTNANSYLSYSLNIFYEFVAVCYAAASYSFFDSLLALQILHVILLTNILRHKIQMLNKMVETKEWSHSEIGVNLRNTILLYEEMRT